MPRPSNSRAVLTSGKVGKRASCTRLLRSLLVGYCDWMLLELVLKASTWPGASTSGPALSGSASTPLPSALRLAICQPCRSMNLGLRFSSSTKRTAPTRGLNSSSFSTTSPATPTSGRANMADSRGPLALPTQSVASCTVSVAGRLASSGAPSVRSTWRKSGATGAARVMAGPEAASA